jgi:hypothetical protein
LFDHGVYDKPFGAEDAPHVFYGDVSLTHLSDVMATQSR